MGRPGTRLTVAVDHEIITPNIIDNGRGLVYTDPVVEGESTLLNQKPIKVSQNFLKVEDFIIPNDNAEIIRNAADSL
jgi:hypothetical protein